MVKRPRANIAHVMTVLTCANARVAVCQLPLVATLRTHTALLRDRRPSDRDELRGARNGDSSRIPSPTGPPRFLD